MSDIAVGHLIECYKILDDFAVWSFNWMFSAWV